MERTPTTPRRGAAPGAMRACVLLALLAGLSAVPQAASWAQPTQLAAAVEAPSTPQVAVPQQIVALDSRGRILAYGFLNGQFVLDWASPEGTVWTNFALGDFDGDYRQEIVATSSVTGQTNKMQILHPVPATDPIDFVRTLPAGQTYHLLTTGRFGGGLTDQIVDSYYYTNQSGGKTEVVENWAGQQQGLLWPTASTLVNNYDSLLQAIAAGDANRDGRADLVLARNSDYDHLIDIWGYPSSNWSRLFWQAPGKLEWPNWNALAVGPVLNNPAYPGNQVVGMLSSVDDVVKVSEVVMWLTNGNTGLPPVGPISGFAHNPGFTAVALANLNGNPSGVRQIIGVRDPGTANLPGILMLDAVGGVQGFGQAGDYGSNAWRKVAAGDIDGDGLDEVAVVRPNSIRLFYRPNVDTESLEIYPPAAGATFVSALAIGDLGFGNAPVLNVDPQTVSFSNQPFGCGETSPIRTVNITNAAGNGPVAWQATTRESPWIQLSKTSGTTPDTINVTVNPAQAGKRLNSGIIRVTADPPVINHLIDVSVDYYRSAPALTIDPSSLSFDLNYEETGHSALRLKNTGTGAALSWSAEPMTATVNGKTWLQINPAAGSTPGSPAVSVIAANALVGQPTRGAIKITAGDPCESLNPVMVPVEVNVADPGFVAWPVDVRLWMETGAASPTRQTIAIERPGPGDPIHWVAIPVTVQALPQVLAALSDGSATVSASGVRIGTEAVDPPAWLRIAPTEGFTDAQMTVTATPMDTGRYDAAILLVPDRAFKPEWVRTVHVAYRVGHLTYFPMVSR